MRHFPSMGLPLLAMTWISTLALTLAAAPVPGEDLEAALDVVSAARIESDVQFLASNALEGRATPSIGLEVAALFLRSRLERLGFEPGAKTGFWHEYPLVIQRLDTEASHIALERGTETRRLEFGTDYFLRSSDLTKHDLTGSIVAVGDGTLSSLEGLDLHGRWALFFDERRSPRHVLRAIEAQGGLGLLVAAGTEYKKRPYSERYAPITRGMTEGIVLKPELAESIPAATVPRVWLSQSGLASLLELAGHSAESRPTRGEVIELDVREVRVPATSSVHVRNVCGYWPGSDPELRHETIVISAHFDHLGARGSTIFHGADDNASGTAGLLALAEALVQYGPLKRSILLLWVSGEEKGLWGSEAWVRDVWLPDEGRPVANLNLDMIGRTAPKELYVTPSRKHSHFNTVAEVAYELAELEGFDPLQSQDQYWRSSDHFNFASILGLPVAYLSSGDHDDYHKATDTADKLDCDKIARTSRLVLRVLEALESKTLR